MNGSRKPNRPMPTGAKNEEGRPQGQPSSEHCSAEACEYRLSHDEPVAALLENSKCHAGRRSATHVVPKRLLSSDACSPIKEAPAAVDLLTLR